VSSQNSFYESHWLFFVIVCKKDGESQTQVMTPGLGQMSFNYF
jgi:hypothetical protein